MVAKTIAGMADRDLARIEMNGTLTFARWSAEDCELRATTPIGLFVAAAAAQVRTD